MQDKDASPIRLVLLHNHGVARGQQIARLAREPGLEIVGDTSDGNAALKLTRELQPDAVLVETHHLDKRRIEAISALSGAGRRDAAGSRGIP